MSESFTVTALSLRDVLGLPTLASINLASVSLRIALWPLVALLALRAVLSFDFSPGNPHGVFHNMQSMWTLVTEPLKRCIRPAKSTPSVIMDAVDQDYVFPAKPVLSPVPDSLAVRYSSQAVTPSSGVSATKPSNLFRPTHIRFSSRRHHLPRVSAILHSIPPLNNRYHNLPVLGILQDPAQWPPAFDSPWMATSVNNLWARRWHQWFRRTFLFLGVSLVFGSGGRILGGFLASGVWHWIMILPFNAKVELWTMILLFGMIGVGAVGERMFLQWTGKRVEGLTGWVWAIIWSNLWFILVVDAMPEQAWELEHY
ncbi:hypothetical protein BU15DRAFT_64336 [Melanogaster broomeanus]|nr:hypothetical protein BU15DRAFT_64336 [Melanogaster broomeanus]